MKHSTRRQSGHNDTKIEIIVQKEHLTSVDCTCTCNESHRPLMMNDAAFQEIQSRHLGVVCD